MVILPLAALVALVLGQRTASGSMREAMVRGSVLWGFALVLLTEVLSAMTLMTIWSVAAGWAIVLGVSLMLMRRRHIGMTPGTAAPRFWPRDFGALSLTQLIAIVVVAVVTLVLALLAAPATEDSMVYHLPRVMHWIQDKSLAHYPTHIGRQLWPSPGAATSCCTASF